MKDRYLKPVISLQNTFSCIKELPLGVPCRKLVLQLKGVVELAAQAKAVEDRVFYQRCPRLGVFAWSQPSSNWKQLDPESREDSKKIDYWASWQKRTGKLLSSFFAIGLSNLGTLCLFALDWTHDCKYAELKVVDAERCLLKYLLTLLLGIEYVEDVDNAKMAQLLKPADLDGSEHERQQFARRRKRTPLSERTAKCLATSHLLVHPILLKPAPGLASYTLGQKTTISERHAQIFQAPIYIVRVMTHLSPQGRRWFPSMYQSHQRDRGSQDPYDLANDVSETI
ncbi:hypothetical protein PCH_Pc16g05810 [Penicillium rubens Wisconsin 54-1255]|uniref:Uncharacterized protein n=1 Tax=Penicillium rubens (strain ATCC 28089 / DSM 1075 / NRRL 1951 / Wisconsin 54-1255) TaxID=500485 RepID=B6H8H3_PENRW|nr:hypothetical protein PCH_Pc16g05810 [Penicillium rubens Wisconsin 54-1255]